MNIVFISDDNYAMPTMTAIVSLYENKKDESEYMVYVIGSELSSDNIEKLNSLSRDKLTVRVISKTMPQSYDNLKKKNLHVSAAALFKFELSDIFGDLERILYLDCDIIAERDLSELYNTELDGYYAAAVKDMKLNICCPTQFEKLGFPDKNGYFNSGVMLLNLKKLREDGMSKKLIDYRINSNNYFMDQDALNVCFSGKVKYLPFVYNTMTSVIGACTGESIQSFYGTSSADREILYSQAVIVHQCTRYKPWDYSNVPFADKWYEYYLKSPSDEILNRTILNNGTDTFAEYRLSEKNPTLSRDYEIIVSLTSYPARIGKVHLTIDSILKQTMKPDRVMLWLAETQFPNKEDDLPSELMQLTSRGLIIRWCEDLRPHKKYYYTMRENPESIVITVDDDVIYSGELIETLYRSYRMYPFAVSCTRAHEIAFEPNGEISPYSKWRRVSKMYLHPSMALVATGVGGILYPPHCMSDEMYNVESIKSLCLNADDLWLKTMEVINLTPTVIAGNIRYQEIEGSQETALWKSNDASSANDAQFAKILAEYNCVSGQCDTLVARIRQSVIEFDEAVSSRAAARIKALEEENKALNTEIKNIRASMTYKLGSFATFIPRKIRSFIKRK